MIQKRKVGVPWKVKNNDTDFFKFTSTITYDDKPISWQKQNKVFYNWLKDPFKEESYIYLLSCDYNIVLPQLAATSIVKSTKQKGGTCFWYNIIKNHKQEDERLKEFLIENESIDLLVIDGVYAKTNINNIDKLRELLAIFDSIPVYVIISGMFGPALFKDLVYHSFNLFMHFGSAPRRMALEV